MKIIKRNIFITLIVIVFAMIAFLPYNFFFSKAEETNENDDSLMVLGDYDLMVSIWDTSQFDAGEVKLTETGAEINGWKYETSKYLKIDPIVPADGNTYMVSVVLPQEFYIVASSIVTPAGYQNVTFTKNDDIVINSNTKVYTNKYSGTAVYTLNNMGVSGTIQLELSYDVRLWDKQANSSITKSDVKPVEVILSRKDSTGNVEELKKVSINKVTAGESIVDASGVELKVQGSNFWYGADIKALHNNYVTITPRINNNSGTVREKVYDKLLVTISLPYYTHSNGTKYYIPIDINSIKFGSDMKYASLTTDTSKMTSEGKVIVTLDKPYWSQSSIEFNVGPLQQELINIASINEFKFSGGSIRCVADGRNGSSGLSYMQQNIYAITYQKEVSENVLLSKTNKTVTLVERPENAVSLLGGFYLENKGTGASSGKNVQIDFDINNSNLTRVTTVNIMSDTVQQYINIKYTLVDNDGKRVYLDGNGNRVESDAEGAIGEWEYSLKNSYFKSTSISNLVTRLDRNMLPQNHKSYYFKSVSYRIEKIDAGAMLFAKSAKENLKAAGNFLGYVDDVNGKNGQTATHKINIISDNVSLANLTNTAITTLQNTSNPTYVVDKLTMNKTSIQAGESVTATGRIEAVSYPYGNCTWVKGITIGILLPSGVSVNEQAIILKNASGKVIDDFTLTSQDFGAGNVLWKIKIADDMYIGVATETIGNLNSGLYIDFSVQLDTSYVMNGNTIFAKDIFFAAGYKQNNAAGGSFSWASYVDKFDLNENGSTTDKIACARSTTTTNCQIVAQTATLDIVDSISVERQGSITSEGAIGTLLSKNDILNYNLDISCFSGGKAEDFIYFVPIPKKTSKVDNFLIENSTKGRFDFVLKEDVTVSRSDVFSIMYTLEEGHTYDSVQADTVQWYTAEEIKNNSLNFEDVTMIKIVSASAGIANGTQIRITAKLIYSGENYLSEAGLENIWHSGGFYKYINSERESAGNFSTIGAKVSIADTVVANDLTLTAAKYMTPHRPGNSTIANLDTSVLTKFVNSQTFSIASVETYNVTLQTKEYILANTDMAGIDANQTFAVTVKMLNGKEYDLLTSSNSTVIGTSAAGAMPEFTFNIYNADAITDNAQARYINVTLVSDNGVTIVQKININREIAEASDPKSAIVAGERYVTFDDITTNIKISEDSAFTAQFIIEYIPSLYSKQEIVFSNTLPKGTNIILENLTEAPTYWYYEVEEDGISSLDITAFKAMGTTESNNYTRSTSIDILNEKLLMIVDFSECETYLNTGTYIINMNVKGIEGVDDFTTDNLTFSTVSKTSYTLGDVSDAKFEEAFNIAYTINLTQGADSKYEGRKLSLVITAPDNIPTDTHLNLNDSIYYLNKNKQFIIPLGDIKNSTNTVTVKLVSNMLPKEAITYDFSVDFWISATANANAPKFGEIIGTKEFSISSNGELNPSLKVDSMNTRVIHRRDLSNTFSLIYDYIAEKDCKVTVELQQKIGTAYQKVTDRLNQVNDMTVHNMGVYNLNAVNGKNEIKFKLSSAITNYTYRMVIRVSDSAGTELLEIPYTFVVTD